MVVALRQSPLGVVEEVNQVIIRGGHAVHEIFEDDCEFLQDLLRLFRNGEGSVVDGREVEVFKDPVNVVLFCSCFVRGYDI